LKKVIRKNLKNWRKENMNTKKKYKINIYPLKTTLLIKFNVAILMKMPIKSNKWKKKNL
jgi:hypothetical protein